MVMLSAIAISAQTTAFSYEGRLTDGRSLANGKYEMPFKLFDAATEGTQIGATIASATVPASNGVFTVHLDFGANAFSGAERFLEISLRPAGSTSPYTKLATRQQIVSPPYAIQTVHVRQWGGADANQEEYIKNTKTQQEDANFNISSDGTVGGNPQFCVGHKARIQEQWKTNRESLNRLTIVANELDITCA
jgi:hypothetical protein